MWHIYKWNKSHEKNEILLFATTQMDTEIIMSSEKGQTEKDKHYDFTYIWYLKGRTNEQTQQNRSRVIDTENEQVASGGQGCRGVREIDKGD